MKYNTPQITFDRQSFFVNGKRDFLISGDFHYFRVPKKDWHTRMRLFRESGGNVLATYIPWLLHEPEEGKILFGDCDWRDLAGFLTAAAEEGLSVIAKPGPYVYSELVNSGIPRWIYEKYPQFSAYRKDGTPFHAISYAHPGFIEKSKRWYDAVLAVIEPFTAEKGGPVVMIQLDNEIPGNQLWKGSIDYNPETMGFGREDGIYARYLAGKYHTVDAMNVQYGTDYSAFSEADPRQVRENGMYSARILRDFYACYYDAIGDYIRTIGDWVEARFPEIITIHNAANASMLDDVPPVCEKMAGRKFLMGMDAYYNLNFDWGTHHPTIDKFLRALYGADRTADMGFPYTLLEAQAGNIVQIPPVLKEDLYTWYMCHLAAGMKGINYYVFTGGENHENSGTSEDIYDYSAPIAADGTVRRNYEALTEFHRVLGENRWLCHASRQASVRIGIEPESRRGGAYFGVGGAYRNGGHEGRMYSGLMMQLLSSCYSGRFMELTKPLDPAYPILIESADTLSAAAQENLIRFVSDGGSLMLTNGLASMDETFAPTSLLHDFIGGVSFQANDSDQPCEIGGQRIYGCSFPEQITAYPDDAEILARGGYPDTAQIVYGIRVRRGAGQILLFSGSFLIANFGQTEALEQLLSSMGAVPDVKCSCRTVYATHFQSPDREGIFLLNLYTGQQETSVSVYRDGTWQDLGHYVLNPMEIRLIPCDPVS